MSETFLVFLADQGALGVVALEDGLARRFLGPSPADALEARIAQLATSRAEVMDVVHDERRRIERDLHDGVQQRLVALGMLLGRARRTRARDPEGADALLLQAHEESRRALAGLREVAWRVYPAVLDEGGLRAALEGRYATELLTGESGAVGYLLKDRVAQVDEFLDALERVGEGRTAFDPEVVRRLLVRTTHTDPPARLTPRESEVLAAMAQGHTNASIAGRLHVSQSAVEKHVNAIFDKLELTGRGEGYSRRVLAALRYLGS